MDKAVARFLDAVKVHSDVWWVWNWLRFKAPPSREEAHFWFMLVTSNIRFSKSPEKDVLKEAKQRFDGRISADEGGAHPGPEKPLRRR